jgi:uncharacterized membrane protein YesL
MKFSDWCKEFVANSVGILTALFIMGLILSTYRLCTNLGQTYLQIWQSLAVVGIAYEIVTLIFVIAYAIVYKFTKR